MRNAVMALTWTVLGLSILFMILALTALFGWNSLGAQTARSLALWGAVPLVSLALALSVAVLMTAAFTVES